MSMAWVRFSSCVETVSNSSSTVEEERRSRGTDAGERGLLVLGLSQADAEGCLPLCVCVVSSHPPPHARDQGGRVPGERGDGVGGSPLW